MENINIIKKQIKLNSRLAKIMSKNGISRLRLTSFGNSIASGYSFVRTIKPLIYRNGSLEKILKKSGIVLDIHHFARNQNNNDEKLFEWLQTNIKESEIHKMNLKDYVDGKIKISSNGLTQENIANWYSTNLKDDLGLQDLILDNDVGLANLVIYNGGTGSFLDNVSRNGKLSHKLTYGIKMDLISLEATLKYIQNSNRRFNTNTQVFLCGAPNFLGLNISEFINAKLRKIANKYANVTYVEPIKSKCIYKKYVSESTNNEQKSFLNKINFLGLDIHYNETEYLRFINNIIDTINKNYLINQAMINIDRNFYNFSSNLELNKQHLIGDNLYIQEFIDDILYEYSKLLSVNQKKELILKLKKYILDRLPSDFYYLGKANFNKVVTDKCKKFHK